MERHEHEPEPPLSPVRRFYNDIRWLQDGDTAWADLLISTDKLLGDELGIGEQESASLRDVLIPDANQFAKNRKWGLDQFMRVPLEVVAPWIDMTADNEKLEAWYKETFSQIDDLTEGVHGHSCYLAPDGKNALCTKSPICPRRTLSTVLQMSVRTPDFDNLNYTIDPHRSRGVALKKMEIAKALNLISDTDSMEYVTRFSMAFERRFSAAPRPEDNPA